MSFTLINSGYPIPPNNKLTYEAPLPPSGAQPALKPIVGDYITFKRSSQLPLSSSKGTSGDTKKK